MKPGREWPAVISEMFPLPPHDRIHLACGMSVEEQLRTAIDALSGHLGCSLFNIQQEAGF